MLTTVLSLRSFTGEGMALTIDFSLETDLSFSFLNLSLISLNLTNLRWLRFLLRRCLISCLVSPACSTLLHIGAPFASSSSIDCLALGRSVILSRMEMIRFLEERERSEPRTPFSSSIHPWMTCQSRGRLERMVLASLIPFLAVVADDCSCAEARCFWLRADRMSLLRLRSLQLRLRFCRSSGGVANTCIK